MWCREQCGCGLSAVAPVSQVQLQQLTTIPSWCMACNATNLTVFYDTCAAWNNLTLVTAGSATGMWCREQCGCGLSAVAPVSQVQLQQLTAIPSWCMACNATNLTAFYDTCAAWNNLTLVTAGSATGMWCREQCGCGLSADAPVSQVRLQQL